MYENDSRTVAALDAGGTHFRFTAMRANRQVLPVVEYPSASDNLDKCLHNLMAGFGDVFHRLPVKPSAISFAFPGPADYASGIFPGRLSNFPAFEPGVALGPMLEDKFHVPVCINNDADLFTYGEALAGTLPDINRKLAEAGSIKRYHNLIGFILGTGFGFGLTAGGNMYVGDNGCCEVYCLPGKSRRDLIAEDDVSLRAVLRHYRDSANDPKADAYTDSRDICRIAEGTLEGDAAAARHAFARFGEAAGFMIAHAACMLDGLVVLGGGLSKAHRLFMPALLKELRARQNTLDGQQMRRIPSAVYNLEDEEEFRNFAIGRKKEIPVYGTGRTALCDAEKRIGIAVSHLGASTATFIGAYCCALHRLDSMT